MLDLRSEAGKRIHLRQRVRFVRRTVRTLKVHVNERIYTTSDMPTEMGVPAS